MEHNLRLIKKKNTYFILVLRCVLFIDLKKTHNIQGGQYLQHINKIIKDTIIQILLAILGKVYHS